MNTVYARRTNWKGTVLFVFVLWVISIAASAQTSIVTDSVCAGSADVVYGITTPNTGSTFDWGFKPGSNSLGTIDFTVSSDNSTIQIDWGLITSTTDGVRKCILGMKTVNGKDGMAQLMVK